MKKIILILLIVVIGITLMFTGVSCKTTGTAVESSKESFDKAEETVAATEAQATTAQAETTASSKVFKIIEPIMGLNNPYVSAMGAYAQEWAKELGYEFIVLDGELDSTKNAQNLEDAIKLGPDLIILMTVDSGATSNGTKKAFEAGIPVIMEHMLALKDDEQYTTAYTGPSSYIQGGIVAEMFYEKLGAGPKKIVELTTVPGQETTASRHNGFVDKVKEKGWELEIIDSQPGNAQVDESMKIMLDFITKYGADGIDGVYAFDDTMAVAALNAIKEAGIDPTTIPIIGVGGSKQGLAAIKAGEMYGTVVQSPKISQISTKNLAMKILNDGIVPPKQLDPYYNYMEHPPCTAANVDEFLPGDW